MILAGGRVDELDVLTFFRPKSVVPFGALYRIIDFPMSNLMNSGIERVGILSQYRPFYLMNHIANGSPWDMEGRNRFATILPPFKGGSASDWYTGTADAVFQNIDFIKLYRPELVLILSGDHIYQMDYGDLVRFHLEKKADVTIGFTEMPAEGSHRFGQAFIEDEGPRGGRVLQYVEKPKKLRFNWASLTVYLFKTEVLLDALDENAWKDSHEFGKDVIPSLLSACKVYGYKHYGYWGYTRTLEEYWQTNMDLLGDNPRIDLATWQLRTNLADRNVRDRQPTLIGPAAKIEDALFYSGCDIRGTVKRSLLFPGVKVEEGAVVTDSILLFDTVVGREANVVRTIADADVTIGARAQIGGDSSGRLTVIGMGSSVPEESRLHPGVTIHPNVDTSSFTRDEYTTGEVVK
jgi:glucose-1-phosphate adenylyltransferase